MFCLLTQLATIKEDCCVIFKKENEKKKKAHPSEIIHWDVLFLRLNTVRVLKT